MNSPIQQRALLKLPATLHCNKQDSIQCTHTLNIGSGGFLLLGHLVSVSAINSVPFSRAKIGVI